MSFEVKLLEILIIWKEEADHVGENNNRFRFPTIWEKR